MNDDRRPDVSIVIPVYNSENTIGSVWKRIHAVLASLGLDFEVIFVDDGSADGSWRELVDLKRANPSRITAIQLMKNFGQHNALMCGFRRSRGRLIVTMDDDLQNPPEEVAKLIAEIERSGLDLVYGSWGRKRQAPWRSLGSGVIQLFYRTVFKCRVNVTSFRIIRRELLEAIFPYELNFTYIDGLLAWSTRRIGSIEVEHQERAEGRSGYSLSRLVRLAFNLFTNFSLLPLQFISGVGALVAVGGILLGVFFVIRHLTSSIGVPGYASIIVAVLVVGGIQLLALGVFGEYLGRLHMNVNRKPQYVERHVLPVERS